MEHRLYPRIPVDVAMLIYRRGLPVATGRIRNASRGGFLVETGYEDLREYQSLEVEFCAVATPQPVRHRVAAHVCRRGADGVALEVDDLDGRTPPAMATLVSVIPQNRTHQEYLR